MMSGKSYIFCFQKVGFRHFSEPEFKISYETPDKMLAAKLKMEARI